MILAMRLAVPIAVVLPLLLLMALGAPTDVVFADSSSPVDCVPCDVLFSGLQPTVGSGRRVQMIEMQLRGEPKSGTGFMHTWASGMLHHACDFLKRSFGEDACRVAWEREESATQDDNPSGVPILEPHRGDSTNRSLIFEPHLGRQDAPCSCDGVDRVTVSVSKKMKHQLPVDLSCTWWRPNKIVAPNMNVDGYGCMTFKGAKVANYSDLVGCMQEAACEIKDDRPQLVILRDPRAVAVSSYYHRKNGDVLGGEFSLEEYLPQILPGICMWTSIRYVLFAGLLNDNSNIFWYNETVARPHDWHRAFLNSVGLHMPTSVVDGAVTAALRGEFSFNAKSRDRHSEEDSVQVVLEDRSWKDDLEPNVILELDSVLRVWLPPVLLAKLGIPLAA